MRRNSLQIHPLAGAIGAEISGVDLAGEVDADTIALIRRAWLDHLVIFFRDQNLPPARFLALARRFGEPIEYPFVKGIDGFSLITPVVKLEHERVNFGGLWHSDTSLSRNPADGHDADRARGAALWRRHALRQHVSGLRGPVRRHAASPRRPRRGQFLIKADVTKTREDRMRDGARADARTEYEALHPVVRTHPETGRKALYVNGGHTVRFKGMTEEESAPLLGFLFAHQIRPEFTCRFRWDVGSLAFWDNRCAQHNPINDYHGFRRVMHRVTLAGDRPR